MLTNIRLPFCGTLALAVLLAVSLGRAQPAVVTPNTNPTFNTGRDPIIVTEDSGQFGELWATAISDSEGPLGTNSGRQTLTFVLVADNPSLFSQQPTIDSAGNLYFTPAPDQYGSSRVAVTLHDDGTNQCVVGNNNAQCPQGCSPTDCSVSVTRYFQIFVNPVNDCPSFQTRGDQTVDENGGQANVVGWAYSVSRGPANEDQQTLAFTVTNDNNPLFAQQPQVVWDVNNPTVGTLQYTPAPDECGQASVTVVARDSGGVADGGCDTSVTSTFTVQINCINDPPSFTFGRTPIVVPENNGRYSEVNWAQNVIPGPTNERSQSMTFNLQFVDPTMAQLFSVQPRLDPNTGELTFTPAENANTFARSVQMYVQLRDDGGQSPRDVSCNPITSCPLLEIQITPVNQPPSFQPGGDIEVWENLCNINPTPNPPQFTNGRSWATEITVGPTNEGNVEGQTPSFEVTSDNTGLFSVQPAIDPQGTLTFTLAENQCGTARVQAQIRDNGVPEQQGNTASFSITVRCSNQPPSFTIAYSNPHTIIENAPTQDISVWATNLRSGPPNEQPQQVQFYVEPDDTTFFDVQPRVEIVSSSTARLIYKVAPNRHGRMNVRVALQDDGGVEYCGSDTYIQTLTIIVTPVNEPPSFTQVTSDVNVDEDEYNTGYIRTGFLVDITPGIGEADPQASQMAAQTVSFIVTVDNAHLFTTVPAISPQGTLTFATKPDAFGDAEVTITAKDSFIPPALSNRSTFKIHITPVNDAPGFSLSADLVGRQVTECTTPGTCTRVFPAYLRDLIPGPANEDTQVVTLSVSVPPQFQKLFKTLPTIDAASGNLLFELAQYEHTEEGNPVPVTVQAKDDGGVARNGKDTTIKTFQLEILNQPNPPSFQPGGDITGILENSAFKQVIGWARAIKSTPISTALTGLSFNVRAADTTMFKQQPRINIEPGNTGTLSFEPAANKFGTVSVSVFLDNLATNQNSDLFTFTVTIDNVNNAPEFTPGADLVINQDSGAQVIPWATAISPGPGEGTQTVVFTVECADTSMFTVLPTMDNSGIMKFTLRSSTSGTTQCTATAKDNGGVAHGGIDTTIKNFGLTVRHINMPPSFLKGADLTVLENIGEGIFRGWARNINVGAGNPSSLLLTFHLTADKTDLFAVQPKIDSQTGDLFFTTANDQFGIATVKIYLQNSGSSTPPDNNKSPVDSFQIIIKSVNHAPSFKIGDNIAVLENSGVFRRNKWATLISPGPANEQHQKLTFTLLPDSSKLFSLPPTLDPATGDLMFAPAQDEVGVTAVRVCLSDDGGVADGGIDNVCKSMTVSILDVNQAPEAILEKQLTVLENSGSFSRVGFLNNVRTGPTSEGTQQITDITVTVPEAQKPMFTTLPRISLSTYELTFEPAPNQVGTADVTVTISDNGGTSNGGVDKVTVTFSITIQAVNQKPSFKPGPKITVFQNSGRYNALWATDISAGPANEASQVVTFDVSVNKPEFFAAAPAIDSQGYLSFTLAKDQFGTAQMTVFVKDNGGTTGGGVDRSTPITATIDIAFINQPPSFTPGADISTTQNSGPFVVRAWATDILAGPPLEHLTQRATLRFIVSPKDPSWFSVQPAIDGVTGDLTFTLSPSKFGTTQLSVSLKDGGGTDNGGTDETTPRLVTVYVKNVNQQPVITTTGDVTVNENAPETRIKNWVTSVSAGENEAAQQVILSLSASNQQLFSSPPRLVDRDLLFTVAKDQFGVCTLTLNATDTGGVQNGGVNTVSLIHRLTILEVNNAPTFTVGPDITVSENAFPILRQRWLTTYASGPANENSQTLTAHFTLDRTDILLNGPVLDLSNGDISFELKPFAWGTITVTMWLTDNGGTSNGGQDTSIKKTFRIIVTHVNQPPTFNPGTPAISVPVTIGTYRAPWASNVSAGPNEGSQTVAFSVSNSAPNLFSATGQPSISPSGELSFTVASGAQQGNATLGIVLRDSEGAVSTATYLTLMITNGHATNNIVLYLSTEYNNFDVENFRTAVANALAIDRNRVVVKSVRPGSVVVTFQIIGDGSGSQSSDALTSSFMTQASNPNSGLSQQLYITKAETEPAVTTGSSQQNGNGGASNEAPEKDSEVNWVALGVGLFAAVVIIALIALAIFTYRKHRKDKEIRASHLPDYEDSPPRSRNRSNPINGTFEESTSRAVPVQPSPARAEPIQTPGKVYAEPDPLHRSVWPQSNVREHQTIN